MIVLSDPLVVQRHAQPEKGQQTSRERGTGHQLEHEGGGHELACAIDGPVSPFALQGRT